MVFKRMTTLAHECVQVHLRPDALCIDATMGNGYDTLFLAQRILPHGRVFSFDIQKQALQITQALLEKNELSSSVTLVQDGHENMGRHLPQPSAQSMQAILFNLGYLPKGDPLIITKPASTIAALNCSLEILAKEGIISVMLYHGHEGGREEMESVLSWASELSASSWSVEQQKDTHPAAPRLLLIRRSG